MTADEMALHLWVKDASLPHRVSPYSPEMGQLIASEQELLAADWKPNFRRGTGVLTLGDRTSEYKWELICRVGSDEYRVKRSSDGAEFRILMLPARWFLFGGDDYSQLIAQGNVNRP